MVHEDSEHDASMKEGAKTSHSNKEEREEIAKREGKIVTIWRTVVILVLLSSAIAVSVGLYRYGTSQEETKFEDKFEAEANKVHDEIGTVFQQTLGSTDAFILQLIGYARYSNSSWPFVTMPAFVIHATKLIKLSKAFFFAVYPFVEADQKEEWEAFAQRDFDWIYESLEVQKRDKDWHGANENLDDFPQSPVIFNSVNGAGNVSTKPYEYMNNYLPTWQSHPLVPSSGVGGAVNYDVWDVAALAGGIMHAHGNKEVVMTPQINALWEDSPFAHAVIDSLAHWAAAYIDPGLDPYEPFSTIVFPIYDALEDVRIDRTQDYPPVGVLTIPIRWRVLIENILPEGSDGMIIVFEDSCGPPFTYRLDGPKAVFLGTGDLHEPEFDDMRVSATLPDLVNSEDGRNSYTGLPFSDSYCPRTINIYPSESMKSDNTTKDPLYFTIAAAFIFLFTSLVFLLYDFFVNKRQRIVMQRALASGAIVSELFPKQVRDQLYEEKQRAEKAEDDTKKGPASSFSLQQQDNNQDITTSRPIANAFDNCTILFGDLVGFTAWASKREPVEVFELLEACYGRFDKIARRRRVFKVETIGDCYVAVTGLPDPQPNHAQIMARFGADCQSALKEVVHGLVGRLGEDTLNLAMRIGLHSGSVTAGVLRGEKGRFQLFGDSVNTAARMESLGKPGRIHSSEAFAEALRICGKGMWLVPREDKVVAKGKGEMSTFWVQVSSADQATSYVESTGASSEGSAAPVVDSQHGEMKENDAIRSHDQLALNNVDV